MLAACIFSSCKQKTDYSKEIAQLDSALVKLNAAGTVFLAIDTNALRTSDLFFKEKLRMIREKLSGDTVKKITAQFLSEAYEQEGYLANMMDNKKFLARAIEEGRKRMLGLKHDLGEDLIEKNKAAIYIVTELGSSEKICDAMNGAIEKAKSATARLDSMKTRVIFLADSLGSK